MPCLWIGDPGGFLPRGWCSLLAPAEIPAGLISVRSSTVWSFPNPLVAFFHPQGVRRGSRRHIPRSSPGPFQPLAGRVGAPVGASPWVSAMAIMAVKPFRTSRRRHMVLQRNRPKPDRARTGKVADARIKFVSAYLSTLCSGVGPIRRCRSHLPRSPTPPKRHTGTPADETGLVPRPLPDLSLPRGGP